MSIQFHGYKYPPESGGNCAQIPGFTTNITDLASRRQKAYL